MFHKLSVNSLQLSLGIVVLETNQILANVLQFSMDVTWSLTFLRALKKFLNVLLELLDFIVSELEQYLIAFPLNL